MRANEPESEADEAGGSRRVAPDGRPSAASRAARVELGQAALLAVALTALWRLLLPLAQPDCCDALQYVTMAGDPDAAVPSPYSYRLLAPRLVQLLGGEVTTTFHLLSLVLLAATGPLVYLLARRLGAMHWAALAGMAGLMSTRGWTYYVFNPYLSDPVTLLTIAAAFLLLVSGWLWLLPPVLVAAAAARELGIGVAVAIWGWLRGRLGDLRAGALAVLLVLPAWLAYRWIVGAVPSSGAEGLSQISPGVVADIWRIWIAPDGLGWWLANAFALSLGLWWVLAVPALRDPEVRRLGWWLLPVFGQFLFGADWSRFALYAFPLIVPAAAIALGRLAPRPRAAVLALAGLQALAPLLDVALDKPTLNYPGPSLWVTVGLMAATAAVLATVAFRARRVGQDAPAPLAGPVTSPAEPRPPAA